MQCFKVPVADQGMFSHGVSVHLLWRLTAFPGAQSEPYPVLQVLFQLWVGQSSEFFRRLVLLLSPANASPKPLVSPEQLPHHILCDVTQGLPHTHAACLEELKRSYEFYRYFETQHQSGLEWPARTKPKSRELNSLQTAVRSLQLHLKALLNE